MNSISASAVFRLQANALRQAKRLSGGLNISLTNSKKLLAQHVYRCASWSDLTARLSSADSSVGRLQLALMPQSQTARDYFTHNLPEMARAIGQNVLTNHNLAGMAQLLCQVFDYSAKEIELRDLVPSLRALRWQPTLVGKDPLAVIETFTTINGIPMKLIGTRVYLPEYMNLGDHLQGLARGATDHGTPIEIMWSSPDLWRKAAIDYLSALDEEADVELKLPKATRNRSMKAHEAWFKRTLAVWGQDTRYGGAEDAEFIPMETPVGTYFVFGVPTANAVAMASSEQSQRVQMNIADNDSALIMIEGLPCCVEWLSICGETGAHDGEFLDYYTALQEGLFSSEDYDLENLHRQGRRDTVFFIRPASTSDIQLALRLEVAALTGHEACTVKTDHIHIADQVLEKIESRDITQYRSQFGDRRYVMELDITSVPNWGDLRGFSLALDIVGDTLFSMSNLVQTSLIHSRRGGGRSLVLELSENIFGIVNILRKKTLLEAAKEGLVLQCPAGFHKKIQRTPHWCGNSPTTPPALINLLENRFAGVSKLSISDLWQHVRMVRYRKDNF